MALRTITIDLEAYELLRSRKAPGQSFSTVIKRELRRGGAGRDLAASLARVSLGDSTVDAIEKALTTRRKS